MGERASATSGCRILIVDDERPARQKLRRLIAARSDGVVIFEAEDGLQAVELIRAEAPDLVFLDVQMPGVSGLDVIEAIDASARPLVVFVTAFEEYAVRAFDAHAVDYLLKPYDADRFDRAFARATDAMVRGIDRAERQRLERALADVQTERRLPLERLLVETEERSLLIPLAKVERLEAARNYVTVHTATETFRVRAILDRLEARLDARAFVRIHRSMIVRTDQVVALEPWGHGDYVVIMRSGTRARLSRRFRDRLAQFLP
jgi:two-component system LytT family response regulator